MRDRDSEPEVDLPRILGFPAHPKNKKNIYKGVKFGIGVENGLTNGSLALPTFGTVMSRGRTHATPHPLTKVRAPGGTELRLLVSASGIVTT